MNTKLTLLQWRALEATTNGYVAAGHRKFADSFEQLAVLGLIKWVNVVVTDDQVRTSFVAARATDRGVDALLENQS